MGLLSRRDQISRIFRSVCLVAAAVSAAVISPGCAGEAAGLGTPVPVTGKVTMDGDPSSYVEVCFYLADKGAPAKLRNLVAKTEEDGTFKFPKVYPGEYQVSIFDRAEELPDGPDKPAEDVGPYAKYGSQSNLKVKVSRGEQEHLFELTSKKLGDIIINPADIKIVQPPPPPQ